MSDEKYNGWKNYETWSIALFIDDDQGLQEEFYEQVKEYKKGKLELYEINDWMKDWVYDWMGVEDLNAYQQQMINASLEEVDYREIIISRAKEDYD
jgi:hypothetical protein